MNNISYVILACYPDKGMKSYGSKALMVFDEQKLLDYQISVIKKLHNNKQNYEIIVICDFDSSRIQKHFGDIKVIELKNNNPIYNGCQYSLYKDILFIDYGCVFNTKTFKNMHFLSSEILCVNKYNHGKLDIGCIKNQNNFHMFYDLPENKFCNIFYISKQHTEEILKNDQYSKSNLLYFEILNMLNNTNKINITYTDNNNYIYFNNMRQKNAINKFIKQN